MKIRLLAAKILSKGNDKIAEPKIASSVVARNEVGRERGKCRLIHVGGEGRKFEKGDIFTMAINLTSMQGTQVGKFDLRMAINNTAETHFNYSKRCIPRG